MSDMFPLREGHFQKTHWGR